VRSDGGREREMGRTREGREEVKCIISREIEYTYRQGEF
jgi:hypothetical protein